MFRHAPACQPLQHTQIQHKVSTCLSLEGGGGVVGWVGEREEGEGGEEGGLGDWGEGRERGVQAS